MTIQEHVLGITPPRHWDRQKLRYTLELRIENKNDGMLEKNLLSLSYGNIIKKDIESADGLVPESYEGYQIVSPGDIVLRLTDLQNDKRSLRQGLVKERGIITSAYDVVFVSAANVPEYWYYFLYALDLSKYYYSLGGGVRQSVQFSDFPNEWVLVPPRHEQALIALQIRESVAVCDALIKLVGGNRSAQVAEDRSLLSLLLKRRNAVIIQLIAATPRTSLDIPRQELLEIIDNILDTSISEGHLGERGLQL